MENGKKNNFYFEEITEAGDETKNKWNDLVSGFSNRHYLQTKEWGDFKSNYGWHPIKYIIKNEASEIIGAVQFLKKKAFLGQSVLYAPRGPIVGNGLAARKDFWQSLKNELTKIAKQNKAFLVKFDLNSNKAETTTAGVSEEISKLGFIKTKSIQLTNCTFINNLTLSAEDIFNNFKKNTRYDIRTAEKDGVTITENNSQEGIEQFSELYRAMGQRTKIFLRGANYTETLWKLFINKGMAKIFLASKDGQPIAGAIVFIWGNKSWYAYGGSSREGKTNSASSLLQYEIMKTLKQANVIDYDLGGVPCRDVSSRSFMSGLYTFKSHFGGEYKEFADSLDLPVSPLLYKIWKFAEPYLNKILRITRKDLFY